MSLEAQLDRLNTNLERAYEQNERIIAFRNGLLTDDAAAAATPETATPKEAKKPAGKPPKEAKKPAPKPEPTAPEPVTPPVTTATNRT